MAELNASLKKAFEEYSLRARVSFSEEGKNTLKALIILSYPKPWSNVLFNDSFFVDEFIIIIFKSIESGFKWVENLAMLTFLSKDENESDLLLALVDSNFDYEAFNQEAEKVYLEQKINLIDVLKTLLSDSVLKLKNEHLLSTAIN